MEETDIMKKLLVLVLTVALVFGMFACAAPAPAAEATEAPAAATEAPAAEATEAPAAATEAAAADAATAAPAGGYIGISMPTQSSERWIKDGNTMKERLPA